MRSAMGRAAGDGKTIRFESLAKLGFEGTDLHITPAPSWHPAGVPAQRFRAPINPCNCGDDPECRGYAPVRRTTKHVCFSAIALRLFFLEPDRVRSRRVLPSRPSVTSLASRSTSSTPIRAGLRLGIMEQQRSHAMVLRHIGPVH